MSYAKARADFEYLETVTELEDQVELDGQREDLMRDPTKARAAQMYESAIGLWFQQHRHEWREMNDPRVKRLARHYGWEDY